MPNLLNRRITFGGDVVPALIASAPVIKRAKRKVTVVQVAGSNREVVDMEDAWECYDQPYTLFVGDGTEDSIQEALVSVADVLYKKDWQELLDDYEPDYFRLAYFEGPYDIENRKTRVGKFDITLRCRPERFLLTGKYPISIATGGIMSNPTKYNAKPLIKITGSGTGTLTVGDTTMSFTDLVDYLYIDCEKQDVFRLPTENRNSLMTGEFPLLIPGNTTITFTGGITGVEITPRYYTI